MSQFRGLLCRYKINMFSKIKIISCVDFSRKKKTDCCISWQEMSFLWSLTAIALVFVLGEIFRIILRRILPTKQLHFARELISSFELSSVIFEIIVLGKFYNFWVGILCSFLLLTFKNMLFILDGALANPCGLFEDIYFKPKKVTILSVTTKIMLQVVGAMLAYPFVRKMWQSSNSELHSRHLQNGISPTLEISVVAGCAIEAVATFLTTMSDFLTRGNLIKYNPIIRSSFCVLLCNSLASTTGLWMNPALATAHTFFAVYSNSSIDLSEHLFVYWLGPIIGTFGAYEMNSRFIDKKDSKVCQRKSMAKKIKKSSQFFDNKKRNEVLASVTCSGVYQNEGLKQRTLNKRFSERA